MNSKSTNFLFCVFGCVLMLTLLTSCSYSEEEKACRKDCYENPYYDQFSGLMEGAKRNECLKRCH